MSDKAKRMVLAIAKDPEVGEEFTEKVVRILDFGAFVELAPGKDGMIHISKLAKERVEKVTDIVNLDDTVVVKVIKLDDKGRIDLKLVKSCKIASKQMIFALFAGCADGANIIYVKETVTKTTALFF